MPGRGGNRKRFSPWLLPFLLLACEPRPDEPPSVLLITIDTLRADHLGCYGYFRDTSPVIDRLASESLLFENVVTTMSTTLPAHTSLLTSSYPARNGVLANYNVWAQPAPTDAADLRSVAQLFSEAEYRTAAFVSVFHLGRGSGVDAGFDVHDGVVAGIKGAQPGGDATRGLTEVQLNERRADATTDRAIEWLEGAGKAPFFLWVHYFDPHTPYDAPEPHGSLFEMHDDGLRQFLEDRRVSEKIRYQVANRVNAYDEEIHFADEHIGRLLDAVHRAGRYDDAFVVLTADHGEGLGEHGIFEHGPIYNEEILIPLLVKFPKGSGPAGERRDDLVSIIDVFPTIIAAGSLPVPTDSFDGVNVLAETRDYALSERERTRQRFGDDVHYTLMDREWKYAFHSEQPDELYHLPTDPEELDDVIGDHPEVAETMRTELLRRVEESAARGAGLEIRETVPAALREALQSLGYVE